MVQDARQRTRTWLDAYLDQSNVLKDDGVSQAIFKTMWAFPDYPLKMEFKAPSVICGIYAVGEPESKALIGHDREAYAYVEEVPIFICAMNKAGATATLVKSQMRIELRRICQEYPTGSIRHLDFVRSEDERFGGETLYKDRLSLRYKRDTST